MQFNERLTNFLKKFIHTHTFKKLYHIFLYALCTLTRTKQKSTETIEMKRTFLWEQETEAEGNQKKGNKFSSKRTRKASFFITFF